MFDALNLLQTHVSDLGSHVSGFAGSLKHAHFAQWDMANLLTLAADTGHANSQHAADAEAAPSLVRALADLLSLLCLLTGLFFFAVGAIGMLRLPDYMNRMHAVSKCSTLGLIGLLCATVLHVETVDMMTKAALTLIFAFVATPVGTHVLAKAALNAGEPMWDKTLGNEHDAT